MTDSITAYDLRGRVATYDQDMELMHPNRNKMVDIALEIFPFSLDEQFQALDLGVGTGYFTKQFLQKFPQANVLAIDGAQSMVNLAKVRLGQLVNRVKFRTGDFRQLNKLITSKNQFNAVFSSYALHHLNYDEKSIVLNKIISLLSPGGWFVNADLIISDSPLVANRIQEIRIEGIQKRTPESDKRFQTRPSTKNYLKELEKTEGDQPITLSEDLQILNDAGFSDVSIFWLEYREVVYGGIKKR